MGVPWFRFYPKDYLSDSKVKMLTREQRSILVDLWCYCAEDGGIPNNNQMVSRLLGESIEFVESVMPCLLPFFHVQGDRLVSLRLQDETQAYENKCTKLRENGCKGGRPPKPNGLANQNQMAPEPEPEPIKDVPPLPPKGERKKRVKVELDCSQEVEPDIRKVFESWPKESPNGEPAKKGSFSQAARAFQRIIDSGEATARELKGCGMLYAKADTYPDNLRQRIYSAWDHRDHAIMHVATFYGPEKRPYRQLLTLARQVIDESLQRSA